MALRWIVGLAVALVPTVTAALEVDGNVAALSDNRFRGESVSNRQPVAQASVQASTGDWFAGIEATSSAYARSPLAGGGAHPELDLSAGWSRSVGILTPSAGVIGYVYPGGRRSNLVEAFATLAGSLGPVGLTAGANYAPSQANLGRDNLYVYLTPSLAIPATPLTLRLSIGREAGALDGGRHAKIDYGAAIEARLARVTLSARWTGNSLGSAAYDPRIARAGVAVGVSAAF